MKTIVMKLATTVGIDWRIGPNGKITHGHDCNCGCPKRKVNKN